MCGRFSLLISERALAEMFRVDDVPAMAPRYNIAPTQPVPAVRAAATAGSREVAFLRWGLVPSWARDPSIGDRLINARAETLSAKPAFRAAASRRRCIVPASGFYEWQRLPGRKQPYHVRFRDGRPFGIASLWERWEGPEGPAIDSCTLITTGANEIVSPLHDRMPAILSPADYDLWLDPGVTDPSRVGPLLRPYPGDGMEALPVGPRVNNPRNDGPGLLAPP